VTAITSLHLISISVIIQLPVVTYDLIWFDLYDLASTRTSMARACAQK